MRPWILSVALCACVSQTNTGSSPANSADANELLNEVWAAGPRTATAPQAGAPSAAPAASFTDAPSPSSGDAMLAPAAPLSVDSTEAPAPGSPAALAEQILAREDLA